MFDPHITNNIQEKNDFAANDLATRAIHQFEVSPTVEIIDHHETTSINIPDRGMEGNINKLN